MPDDPCSDVRDDILNGTPTRYTAGYPVYRVGYDPIEEGEIYVLLDKGWGQPVQTVSGSILYTRRGCQIEVVCPNPDIRDDIYDDICDILIATSRGYIIKKSKYIPQHRAQTRMPIEVEMLL